MQLSRRLWLEPRHSGDAMRTAFAHSESNPHLIGMLLENLDCVPRYAVARAQVVMEQRELLLQRVMKPKGATVVGRIRTIRGTLQVARTDSAITCRGCSLNAVRAPKPREYACPAIASVAVLTHMPYSRQPPPCCVHAVVSLQLERLDHQCLQPVFRNQ